MLREMIQEAKKPSTYKVELITTEPDMHGDGGGTYPNAVWNVLKLLKEFGAHSETKIFDLALYDLVDNKVDYSKMVKSGIISKLGHQYQITDKGKKEFDKISTRIM